MIYPTHLAAGLIIGKLTGNYPVAITAAMIIDLDHGISYFRNGILFQPKKLFAALTDTRDPWGGQRHFLHNPLSWLIASSLSLIFLPAIWLPLSAGYLSHLVLDALDSSDFFPFYPHKKINLKGPIKYFSKQEFLFTAVLLLIYLII